MDNLYPWCIVAYDSLERSPDVRIQMMKEMGFTKYAYDWRDRHLDDVEEELRLAVDNEIEVISVWLWLNAKRDSLGKLSPANTRIFKILEKSKLETTIWMSFSNNYFKDLTQEESMKLAIEMVDFVAVKASKINCGIALYNHKGWFGNPYNQIEIIKALPHHDLSMVYNFHHAQDYMIEFPDIVKTIKPYLSAVNLNGMLYENSPKILPIGAGDAEADMINLLIDEGFNGPWGILGHVEGVDVKRILEQNIKGLHSLEIKSWK
jgi:hypothetical protein